MNLSLGGKTQQGMLAHFLHLTLCLEALVDHRFAAASTQGPGRPDEKPDEGGCREVQTLCQAEESGGLQPVHFCTALFRGRHWGSNMPKKKKRRRRLGRQGSMQLDPETRHLSNNKYV